MPAWKETVLYVQWFMLIKSAYVDGRITGLYTTDNLEGTFDKMLYTFQTPNPHITLSHTKYWKLCPQKPQI